MLDQPPLSRRPVTDKTAPDLEPEEEYAFALLPEDVIAVKQIHPEVKPYRPVARPDLDGEQSRLDQLLRRLLSGL